MCNKDTRCISDNEVRGIGNEKVLSASFDDLAANLTRPVGAKRAINDDITYKHSKHIYLQRNNSSTMRASSKEPFVATSCSRCSVSAAFIRAPKCSTGPEYIFEPQ